MANRTTRTSLHPKIILLKADVIPFPFFVINVLKNMILVTLIMYHPAMVVSMVNGVIIVTEC